MAGAAPSPSTNPDDPPGSSPRAGDPLSTEPRTPKASDAIEQLARVSQALDRVRLDSLVRQQPVCFLPAVGEPKRLFDELYVSIADLETSVALDGRLDSDQWLFQYFTQLLDERMLRYLAESGMSARTRGYSVNLNVATVLSPTFDILDAAVPEPMRCAVAIEFQKIDALGDPWTFLEARDLVRSKGYRVCLDGLNVLALPFVDWDRLQLDLIKVRWHPAILNEGADRYRNELVHLLSKMAAGRLVLCRADSERAIVFGRSLGIELYQGYFVDRLLAASAASAPGRP